jgi:hypothetical protein
VDITSRIVVEQENVELMDATATTMAVIFTNAPHRMAENKYWTAVATRGTNRLSKTTISPRRKNRTVW